MQLRPGTQTSTTSTRSRKLYAFIIKNTLYLRYLDIGVHNDRYRRSLSIMKKIPPNPVMQKKEINTILRESRRYPKTTVTTVQEKQKQFLVKRTNLKTQILLIQKSVSALVAVLGTM
jgi:hypothetical protein